MGNYEELKTAISNVIKTNGNKEITGSILQNALLTIISTIGSNSTFAGIAIPNTNPGTPDANVFYLTTTPGIYTSFNNKVVNDNELAILYTVNGNWTVSKLDVLGRKTLGLYNVDVNIPLETGFYTAETARSAIPTELRKIGLIITYKTDSTNSVVEQYTGASISGWINDTNWSSIGGEGGNKILNWNTDIATTRKQVPSKERKAGMQINYLDPTDGWVNEQYIGTLFTDSEWVKNRNWKKLLNEDDFSLLKNEIIEKSTIISDGTREYSEKKNNLDFGHQYNNLNGEYGINAKTATTGIIELESGNKYTVEAEVGTTSLITYAIFDADNNFLSGSYFSEGTRELNLKAQQSKIAFTLPTVGTLPPKLTITGKGMGVQSFREWENTEYQQTRQIVNSIGIAQKFGFSSDGGQYLNMFINKDIVNTDGFGVYTYAGQNPKSTFDKVQIEGKNWIKFNLSKDYISIFIGTGNSFDIKSEDWGLTISGDEDNKEAGFLPESKLILKFRYKTNYAFKIFQLYKGIASGQQPVLAKYKINGSPDYTTENPQLIADEVEHDFYCEILNSTYAYAEKTKVYPFGYYLGTVYGQWVTEGSYAYITDVEIIADLTTPNNINSPFIDRTLTRQKVNKSEVILNNDFNAEKYIARVAGLDWCALGDSYNAAPYVEWLPIIRERFQLNDARILGVSSSTITTVSDNNFIKQVDKLVAAKQNGYVPHIITIFGGTNDSLQNTIPGKQTPESGDWETEIGYTDCSQCDKATMYGATRYICETLQKEFPFSNIIFVSPIANTSISAYNILTELMGYVKRMCEYLGIKYIDLLHESGYNIRANVKYLMPFDMLHPFGKNYGIKTVSKFFEVIVNNNYVFKQRARILKINCTPNSGALYFDNATDSQVYNSTGIGVGIINIDYNESATFNVRWSYLTKTFVGYYSDAEYNNLITTTRDTEFVVDGDYIREIWAKFE